MRIPGLSLLSVIVTLLGGPAVFAAPAPQFALGLGVGYARGDFGTDATSTYSTFPLIFDWFAGERFNLELTVPFLDQKTSNTGYAASGAGAGVAAAKMGSGGRGVTRSAATVVGSSENQSGLGDITLTAAYGLLAEREDSPALALTGYLKFPTADEDKGLGTGSFDWGPGLLLAKWFGAWQPFGEGRYVFQGASREETGARDYLTVDAGLGHGWSEELYLALFVRTGTVNFDGMSAPLELRLKSILDLGGNNSAEFYLVKGLSDGSQEYGGGLTFYRSF